jgi:hypothetical protein
MLSSRKHLKRQIDNILEILFLINLEKQSREFGSMGVWRVAKAKLF